MSENTPQNPPTEETVQQTEFVVEPNRLQKFVIKHPRLAKASAIIGGAAAIVGTAVTVNTMRKNKHHLDAAADHVLEAGREVAESVSPTPETTDA